jgi:GNAT superfamily N-acetyltransferase
MHNQVRKALADDVSAIVALSEAKRLQYQSYQPLFWRKAEDSREKQASFLQHLFQRDNIIALVHERDDRIDGFVIATLVPSPPVYAAGLTCAIDDFCVAEHDWSGVGNTLLEAATQAAKERGAVQCVVVCGHLDQPKREMLSAFGHTIASEWWVKPI